MTNGESTDPDADDGVNELATMFRWFAANSYGDSSPIYRAVIDAVADDPLLLDVVMSAPADARHPGVLLGTVKYLLAGGIDHVLGECYSQLSTDGVADAFRSFVLINRQKVIDVMEVRRVQTNEVARTSVLAPVVTEVQRRVGQPLAVLDVGTSAGLNLLLDRVHIDYGHSTIGPSDSPVQLICRALDDGPAPGPELDIRWRAGLDHTPIDLSANDDLRWLQACIWPEHVERIQRLATAAELQATDPPRLIRGDAVEALPALIAEVPNDLALVIVTSWVAVYLSGPQRGAFERAMSNANRPIAWVSAEFPDVVRGVDAPRPSKTGDQDLSKVAIVWFPGNGATETREFIAWSHNHGTWLDWPVNSDRRREP